MSTDAPPPIQAGGVPAGRTSRMAIASLVLGIFGCTSFVGLILGIIALVKIKESRGTLAGRGLAIAGICVSGFMFLVVIPLVAMIAGMMLPQLAKAKQRAQAINCMTNLRQLGVAARTYAQSAGGKLPSATNWCDVLQPHVNRQNVFYCPSEKSQLCGYGYNAALSGRVVSEVDPLTVMFFEIPGGWNVSGGPEQLLHEGRHGNLSVVFADGSAQQLPLPVVQNLRWDP